MRNLLLATTAVFLLSHCAVKHQPSEFAPYFFSQPESQFSMKMLAEMRQLESKPQLLLLEKKRLLDLYTAELKSAKPGNPRFQALSETMAKLGREVEEIEKDRAYLQLQILRLQKQATPEKKDEDYRDPELKKVVSDAYQLWNRNDNEAAFIQVEELVRNQNLKDKASKREWFRILNLRFRILLDLGDYERALVAYGELKQADACASETAQAGFIISLLTFSRGKDKEASAIFDTQCDPDTSPFNLMKRKYWAVRFRESDVEMSSKAYNDMGHVALPTYYSLLAQLRLGKRVTLPQVAPNRVYLQQEFSVSGSVHDLLSSAEERLRVHLRKDAALYLIKAATILKKDAEGGLGKAEAFALLYTAHLLRAAGNHFEAFKVYNVLASARIAEEVPASWIFNQALFEDMYPRPQASKVDWLSRLWKVDKDFIYSIMRQESAFNPTANSSADARGLMQLMPSLGKLLAQQWGYQKYFQESFLFCSEENLKLAVYHLHQLEQAAPHVALMAAAYNAGISRVIPWWQRYGNLPLDVFIELIPINETRSYVKLVLRNLIYYRAMRTGGSVDAALIPFYLPPAPGLYNGAMTS